uniref:Uncharacterized protein n=1 Tax=Chromera velia CCMP2878 TaxID=1169474 RepID=A0A0G4I333_9ALVE|eukprot:Cvel_10538.t1-p1 / transcript=Cvel_10538.t1 / gene=Cvel_10538 / organism=Chromera_velia_CCMP2878 / gene_product=hypothetical protein / transcript_product=hypothetical protein / location=Cvel_scaffold638:14196-17252(+) / protein_length=154 / sequence_SO=supercontig / SO=protein_coding / is_pseudo=false
MKTDEKGKIILEALKELPQDEVAGPVGDFTQSPFPQMQQQQPMTMLATPQAAVPFNPMQTPVGMPGGIQMPGVGTPMPNQARLLQDAYAQSNMETMRLREVYRQKQVQAANLRQQMQTLELQFNQTVQSSEVQHGGNLMLHRRALTEKPWCGLC